jgi:NAD+ synthase
MEAISRKITNWLKEEVKQSGAKGALFGLSGGVDSATVAVLSKKALGAKTLALILPCHSDKQDLKDAQLVVRKFKIKAKTVDLTKIYDNLLKILPKGNKLALANLRPRLRMLTLYYFANTLNYLVVGTGNKSELMVGYFTKYGDGGVDLLPLGDLFKTDVKELARDLEIPPEIITKPPTAGLWPGQTDEGEMGITYQDLDKILSRFVFGEKPQDKLARKVEAMISASAHKRQGPKICRL